MFIFKREYLRGCPLGMKFPRSGCGTNFLLRAAKENIKFTKWNSRTRTRAIQSVICKSQVTSMTSSFAVGSTSRRGPEPKTSLPSDFDVPKGLNKDLWKAFGTETEAGPNYLGRGQGHLGFQNQQRRWTRSQSCTGTDPEA